MSLTFSVLEGTMLAWVPPPPGNRIFVSFLRPPHLVVAAKPEVCGISVVINHIKRGVRGWEARSR